MFPSVGSESEDVAKSMSPSEYYSIRTLQSCIDDWNDVKAETCNMLDDEGLASALLDTFKIWSCDTEQAILSEIPDRGDCEIFRYLFWRWCRYEAGRLRSQQLEE